MDSKRNYIMAEIYKQGKPINIIIGWIIVSVLGLSFIYIACEHAGDYTSDSSSLTGLFFLPILLLSGLYGYMVAFVIFLVGFILSIVFSMDYAYTMVVYIAPILTFSLCSQNMWFKKIRSTIGACFITLLTITINEYLCYQAVANMNYNTPSFTETTFYTPCEIATIFGSGLLIYFIFNHCPDKVKWTFPLGVLYTKSYENDSSLKKKIRRARFSAKITFLIAVVEIILGIGVAIFMMVLFPDIKIVFIKDYYENNPEQANEVRLASEQDGTSFYEEIISVDYKLDNAMISFDLKMIMLMFCAGIPVAAFSNYYIRSYVAGPLVEMSDFMEEYVNTHDDDKILFGHSVDDIKVKSNDEVRVIYEALHATVYEIEAYIGRIQERNRLENDLEVAKKASEAKSSFLSNMSHEIRTPINAVLGMDEMILRESDDNDIIEYAMNIKSAGNSLLSLVNDILDFSKIEAQKLEIIPVSYDLGSVINDLVNMVFSKALEKGLDIDIEVDSNIPDHLFGDEIRIKQVVTNLLSNAVKYTEKGVVSLFVSYVRIDNENISLKFIVRDTGMGIREEDMEKLYSPFERIEEEKNRTIEGTGLGMNIVQSLLRLMDSHLEVKSEYGQGSEFSFEIKQKVLDWEAIGNFKQKYKEYVQSRAEYREAFTAPNAKILIVDDTDMNLTVIKSLLKKTKIQIVTAESGFETLDLVTKEKFDIIFLDHRMPNMDGIETYEKMKTLENNLNDDVPVIALTANAVSGAKEEYLAHGFIDYISKPVNGVELEQMIAHYLPMDKIESVSANAANATMGVELINDTAEACKAEFINIDVNEGIKNCGDETTYNNVLKDFAVSIDSKANAIEKFLEDGDIRNYTVFVHALKSSARLIGALELSQMAADMEIAGNENQIDFIKEKTPELIERYRSLKDELSCVFSDSTDKEEIPVSDLQRAFRDIRELAEAYDYDTADAIINFLDGYKIPDDYIEKYLHVKELITAVDRDGVLEYLKD